MVHGLWTGWILEHMFLSFLLMAHFSLLDFRGATSEYMMLIMDGKYERTFLRKTYAGQLRTHLLLPISAIFFVFAYSILQVYASLSPIVNIVNVGTSTTESYANVTDIHDGLDFSLHDDVVYSFNIFSVKFSSDGRELVAGSSDCSIYVYDLEANKLTSRIPAHSSDVNTVTFADDTGHLIYSGSDDNLCKVWDRRCFTTKGQVAGVLTGHLEGVTFIDSRGDGRYFISNGKDQTIKMWDIRKMSSTVNCFRPRISNWDYRYTQYPPDKKYMKHPSDQSLATYRGHSVLRTLIRCYFSPAYSTGQKYIYTGSHDACVYIYDVVSGDQVERLDGHQLAVRDCSWHPYYPMLVSSSWDGRIARWEFSGNGEVSDLIDRSRGPIRSQMFRVMYL
ncbi:LEC14B homolog isoform X3 [Elaeis guineensis]|uniref:LEC14B homolog isoform X3 n=1 Tax=Elaeis guineensis var. tenera TaxID=51953 RepID=UPI003C6D7A3C